ncbi:type 1 glutamine amidotransferase domain-containing protein [Frankia sp. QA3]|uniref:type 1 glutamine amidotransferase domain-containing protein n=1 Tax=Frankia sp. QA3 TaxID=710111 RepID=UPI000269C683|nr:type 1 glutamine amidotransferase domain-containing protein [Frankia sp. QA3]EIV94022.1 putative intracellular protease/amidase [Frankia sp. QA3]
MVTPSVLIVLTSHDRFGDTDRATGFWFEELAAPYQVLRAGGVDVRLASPAGGRPPTDPASLAPQARTSAVEEFLADPAAAGALDDTPRLDAPAVVSGQWDGVFLAGGHGTMWDFPGNAPLTALIELIATRGGVVGAVCHGAAGLLDASVAGTALVAGRALAAFSDAEEELVGATPLVPFSLERRLRDAGARYEAGAPFAPHTVRDGLLVTGQNPASSEAVARAFLDALRSAAAPRG